MIQNIENNTQNSQNEIKNFEAYGGFWRRVASSILDKWPTGVALILISIYIVVEVGIKGLETLDSDPDYFLSTLLFPIIFLVLIFLANIGYNIYLYYTRGTTIGYEILGMKIISEETGEKPTSSALLGRFGMKVVFEMIIAAPIIGWIFSPIWAIMFAIDKRKQGLHEKPAKTLVVMEKVKRVWVIWVVNLFPIILLIIAIVFAVVFDIFEKSQILNDNYDEDVSLIQDSIIDKENNYEY